jgi:hypothetical protein
MYCPEGYVLIERLEKICEEAVLSSQLSKQLAENNLGPELQSTAWPNYGSDKRPKSSEPEQSKSAEPEQPGENNFITREALICLSSYFTECYLSEKALDIFICTLKNEVSNISREILSPPPEYEIEGLDVPFNHPREAIATLKTLFKTRYERYALIDRKFWAVRNFTTSKVPILSDRQLKLASDLRDVWGARLCIRDADLPSVESILLFEVTEAREEYSQPKSSKKYIAPSKSKTAGRPSALRDHCKVACRHLYRNGKRLGSWKEVHWAVQTYINDKLQVEGSVSIDTVMKAFNESFEG